MVARHGTRTPTKTYATANQAHVGWSVHTCQPQLLTLGGHSTHLLLSLGRWLHSVECWGRPGSTGSPPLCLRWRRHCLGGRYSPGRLQGSGLELPSGRAALRCSLLPRSVCWAKVGTAIQVSHDVTYACAAGQQTACRLSWDGWRPWSTLRCRPAGRCSLAACAIRANRSNCT